jgi:hypothetical protein
MIKNLSQERLPFRPLAADVKQFRGRYLMAPIVKPVTKRVTKKL